MALTIKRLEVALGAEVTGVDLTGPVAPAVADRLRRALYEHQVLIIRGQHLDAAQHVAVAAIFGAPRPPEPFAFLGTTDPIQTFVRDARRGQTADKWHTDTPFMAEPPIAGVLMPLHIPKLGGGTAWTSLYSIYNGLSDRMRALCEGLSGEHSMRPIRGLIAARSGLSPDQLVALDEAFPDRLHPLILRHWVTGKPLVFDGGEWMERIVGLPEQEAAMVRELLRRQINKVEYQFKWRWTPGDLAVWDEQSTNHIGLSDHYEVDPERTMRSIFVHRADHSAPKPER